MVFSYLILFNK